MKSIVRNQAKTDIYNTAEKKILSYPQHLSDFLQKKPVAPISLEIHPSERCNHRCTKCQGKFMYGLKEYRGLTENGEFLDFRLLDSVFEEKAYWPKGVIISGTTGEPLLHPDITHLFEKLYKFQIPTVLITNGTMINGENAPIMVKSCDGIRISLDAYNETSFSKTHGIDWHTTKWDELLESIKVLVATNRSLGKSKIGIGYLTDENTKSGMAKAAQLAKDLGVDYIHFRPFHYHYCNISQELEQCNIYTDDKFKVLHSVYKYSPNHRTYDKCYAAWFYSLLDSKGDFYICCHHISQKQAWIGSLRDLSWKEYINKAKKRIIDTFELKNCVPNCRLHVHNNFLSTLNIDRPIEHVQPIEHAAFL